VSFALWDRGPDANLRRQYIQESMGGDAAEKAAAGGIAAGEKISRSTLEEEARQSTLKGQGTPEQRFWQRQEGQAETIAIGKEFIAKVSAVHR
jgi:anoctamin-10